MGARHYSGNNEVNLVTLTIVLLFFGSLLVFETAQEITMQETQTPDLNHMGQNNTTKS